MIFLSRQEFSQLSELQKSDYYDELLDEKNNAITVKQLEELIPEFKKINYKDSDLMAKELEELAIQQVEADNKYNIEKRKRGFFLSVAVICAAVLIASVITLISMF